jgi:hypothetical protein
VYLVGGPPFSGTTLLALMLNQGDSVCLDEPDFHDPGQSHRGIPFLQSLFPDARFPLLPERPLSHAEAVQLIAECERALAPRDLGMKTCGATFVSYARIYRGQGYPVIAIVRDIRDALMTPLPAWVTEATLNADYRIVWDNLDLYDLWVRYEELVTDTANVLDRISSALSRRFEVVEKWEPAGVSAHMLKLDRHEGLKRGRIVRDRIGVWRGSGRPFSEGTRRTATMMGY